MPNLEATRTVRYGGKDRQPGDQFEASDKDAKILKAIGKAKDWEGPAKSVVDLPDEPKKTAPKPTVQPKAMKAQEVEDQPIAPLHYLRRDMRAEDGPTGGAKSAQSSPRGRQPKKQNSDD